MKVLFYISLGVNLGLILDIRNLHARNIYKVRKPIELILDSIFERR